MDGVTGTFKTITGGTDADGAFVAVSSTCTNVDCHSGATTPGWYYAPDAAAPTWTPNSGIAATNPNQGGVLNVTWNAAADAYPSNPVSYDLYRATTNSAAAVFAGPPIATDLAGTSATVTGLNDGTTYYFGVRAKDNWASQNVDRQHRHLRRRGAGAGSARDAHGDRLLPHQARQRHQPLERRSTRT